MGGRPSLLSAKPEAKAQLCHSDRSRSASDGAVEEPAVPSPRSFETFPQPKFDLCDEQPLPRISKGASSSHVRGLSQPALPHPPQGEAASRTGNPLLSDILPASPPVPIFCRHVPIPAPGNLRRMNILGRDDEKKLGSQYHRGTELTGGSPNRAYDRRDAIYFRTSLQPSPGNCRFARPERPTVRKKRAQRGRSDRA